MSSGRVHQRVPFSVEVEYRTASSFLVAYSVNMSRGGIFLETEHAADPGTEVTLRFTVPGAGPLSVTGRVTWCRASDAAEGPRGLGIEFHDIGDQLGRVIDALIAKYQGITVLLLSRHKHDREAVARLVRSILTTADVVLAGDARSARSLLSGDIDVAVIDIDADPRRSYELLAEAAALEPPVPTVALAAAERTRQQAVTAGACEACSNPPTFSELQTMLVRALGRPAKVSY